MGQKGVSGMNFHHGASHAACLLFLLFVVLPTGNADHHWEGQVTEWIGYVGAPTYRPQFSCTGGRLISITNISSIGEYCINEYGYWAGSHCPCHWGVCTTSTCPVGTMEVYPTHYDQILSCNGTTDCSILTPPRTWRSCYRFPWNNIHVDFIQILGVCVTESHFYTTTRSTFPLTTRPPLSTNRPMRKTTSSSDYYTSTREASREIYVTTDGIPRVPTADGQEEVNASENNTFTGTVAVTVAVPIAVVILVSTGIAVVVVLLLRKRNKKHQKGSTAGAINNPVYTLPYDIKFSVPDLVPPDDHPAWNPSTVEDQGYIYNDPTAPYAVVQKPRTRSNPDELDVIENCVYANSRDSSLSNTATVSEGWGSEDTAQQLYNEENPTAANRQGSGSETGDPDKAPSNTDTELKDIEVLENELYDQDTD